MAKQKNEEKIILEIGGENVVVVESAVPISNKGASKEELIKALRKAAKEGVFAPPKVARENAQLAC